jgi:hypothetical protein
MHADDVAVPCYSCRHDVNDHDERARCLSATCACGWLAEGIGRSG